MVLHGFWIKFCEFCDSERQDAEAKKDFMSGPCGSFLAFLHI